MDSVWFNPDEEDTLCLSPFWVFSSLIGRHRGLDDVDLTILIRCVERASDAPGELVFEILDTFRRQTERLAGLYENDTRPVSAGLSDVAILLVRASRSEAQLFRDMLVGRLGVLIATAKGPFGRSADLEDLQRLQLLPVFLEAPDIRPFPTARVVA